MTPIQVITIGRKVGNIYEYMAAPICKDHGINQTAFDILMFCANNPEHNTARDICAMRGIKSGIVSVAVEKLIHKGLLRREDDPRDRRVHRLVPTQKAQPIIHDGRLMQQRFGSILRNGITGEEETVLHSIADKLMANIDKFEQEKENQ